MQCSSVDKLSGVQLLSYYSYRTADVFNTIKKYVLVDSTKYFPRTCTFKPIL